MWITNFLGWIEAHPGFASWVQAVGAIAALCIAIWIPNSHRKSDRMEAQKKGRALLCVFLADCEYVITITQGASATSEVRNKLLRELITRVRVIVETDTNADRAAECLILRYQFEGILYEVEQYDITTQAYVELTDRALQRISNIQAIHCPDVHA